MLPLLLCLAFVACCRSQNPLDPIAKSHIEGNVPKGESFDEYLKRDLNSYFCGAAKDCRVEYEFLRDGPTQTGIAYPKYYLWARCLKGGTVATEGAVRLAAVEQKGFDITHFLARDQIAASPEKVASIFPVPLVDKIVEKARSRNTPGTKTK
jgi:hypothetical protein